MATVALQDPDAAAAELERCIRDHGFCGVNLNGYTDTADGEGLYYDDVRCDPFWAKAQELDVPVYLHPREPLPGQRRMYRDFPPLVRAAWGFGVETGGHAIRLILGGVFDRFPALDVVLGHLGETLPFAIWRLEHRVSMTPVAGRLERPISAYLRENFHVSTSGNFSSRALIATILELGADRVMFAVDYPYESMAEGAEWFDGAPINTGDREKIARLNAQRLFRL
jgi:2,3-dihydroxybenzoate decarboxylase